MLESDIIKKMKMKEKDKKEFLRREGKPNSVAEIWAKIKFQAFTPCKIFETILKLDLIVIQKYEQQNKEIKK